MQQNSRLLQQKLAEKSKLLSQLDQAKMQEEMNTAMAQLNESVGDDVPTLAEVQEKIQARYAKAKGTAELTETSVESRVLEIEQATANVEAQSRLAELRASSASAARRRRAPGLERAAAAATHRPADPSAPPSDGPVQPEAVSRQETTRSSRWTTSWATPAEARGRGGRRGRESAAADRHQARGRTAAVGPCDVDRVAGVEAPVDVDHARRAAGSSPLDERPASTVVDRRPAGDPAANAIHSLRAASLRRWAAPRCPPAAPATAPPGRRSGGVGDHRAHPRPGRDASRRQLRRHPAAPPPAAAAGRRGSPAAGRRLDAPRSAGLRGRARVGGVDPGGVGEQHEQVGADVVGDEARRCGRCRRSGSRRWRWRRSR